MKVTFTAPPPLHGTFTEPSRLNCQFFTPENLKKNSTDRIQPQTFRIHAIQTSHSAYRSFGSPFLTSHRKHSFCQTPHPSSSLQVSVQVSVSKTVMSQLFDTNAVSSCNSISVLNRSQIKNHAPPSSHGSLGRSASRRKGNRDGRVHAALPLPGTCSRASLRLGLRDQPGAHGICG